MILKQRCFKLLLKYIDYLVNFILNGDDISLGASRKRLIGFNHEENLHSAILFNTHLNIFILRHGIQANIDDMEEISELKKNMAFP